MLVLIIGLLLGAGSIGAAEESGEDSAEGLPEQYAKNYLVARSTQSRDKNFAVIYPTLEFSESKDAKDLLVALKPFSVLAPLPTDDPYFQNKNHGGISAQWSEDNNVALVKLESKWGPGDVFVVELAGGQVKRITNVLQNLTQLLLPTFRAAMPKKKAYNDNYQFIFEPGDDYEPCTLGGNKTVVLNLSATNDPKSISAHPWRKRIKAEWDIAAATFSSQKITDAHK
ncbi:MAG: hypothetical protein QOF22_2188 [Bradyrhizobium sp.]|nr:hypothetical protein [Bradyrhizobium sp.]